eukprot:49626-Chlamydomonas_euryale.AAC.1
MCRSGTGGTRNTAGALPRFDGLLWVRCVRAAQARGRAAHHACRCTLPLMYSHAQRWSLRDPRPSDVHQPQRHVAAGSDATCGNSAEPSQMSQRKQTGRMKVGITVKAHEPSGISQPEGCTQHACKRRISSDVKLHQPPNKRGQRQSGPEPPGKGDEYYEIWTAIGCPMMPCGCLRLPACRRGQVQLHLYAVLASWSHLTHSVVDFCARVFVYTPLALSTAHAHAS